MVNVCQGWYLYETESPFIDTVEEKTVVTGKVIPEDEVEIKPQIPGIIESLFVEEGDLVMNGDLLAKIKVVPNEQALNSAEGRLANSKIVLKNAEIDYKRDIQGEQFVIRNPNAKTTCGCGSSFSLE